MNNPTVTVCMPAYNSARFIADAIESVLNQSFAGFELLIIDDCSTDSTAEIASYYAVRDSRIIFKVNDKNLGMVANWNLCLETAQGKYIKYLFGDDVLSSNEAIQRMASVLDNDSTISIVASGRNIIDAESNFLKRVSFFADGTLVEGTHVISRCLSVQRNLVGEPSVVMFRKGQAIRGFNAEYNQLVDLEMWFHLLEQGKYAHIGESLSSFRVHPDQQTKKNVQNLVHLDESFLLFKSYLDRPYVKLSRYTKKFLFYSQNYRIWKHFKKHEITRQQALAKISAHCEPGRFLLLIPLYKIYSPLWKLRCLFGDLTVRFTHTWQLKNVEKSKLR